MSHKLPAPGEAQSLEAVNSQLREMLEREVTARIEARCLVSELTRAVVAGDRGTIKRLLLELNATLS